LAEEREHGEQLPPHFEGGLPILPGPADREDAARNKEKQYEREYKREQVSIQRGILRTQIALVAFGILGAVVGLWEAGIAQQSADNSQKSVLLAQKSERDSRLMSEKILAQNVAESRRTLREMASQTSAQAKSAGAAEDAVGATARQVRDYEASEAGRIRIDFSPQVSFGGDSFFVIGKIGITNIGSSELTHVGALSSYGISSGPIETQNVPPTIFDNGATLAANGPPLDCCEVNVGTGFGQDIQQGKKFFGFEVAVSYKDIFGNYGVENACFEYQPKLNKFVGCPLPTSKGKGHPVYLP
jgi:hypothetical protein